MNSNPTDGDNTTNKDNNKNRRPPKTPEPETTDGREFQNDRDKKGSLRRLAPRPKTVKVGAERLPERAAILKELFEAESEDGRLWLAAEAGAEQEGVTKDGHISKQASTKRTTSTAKADSESEEGWSKSEGEWDGSEDEVVVAETRVIPDTESSLVVLPTSLEHGQNVEQHDRMFVPQQTLVGAHRIPGGSLRGFESDTSGSLIIGGGNDNDRHSLDLSGMQSYSAQAELVSDPVIEVGADRTDELMRQFEHEREEKERLSQSLETERDKKRRLLQIGMGVFLLSVVTIAIILSAVLVDSGNGDSTPSPTPAPTSQQEALWIALIQSRMSSITFEDPSSPQRQALDWMSQDAFTFDLDNDELFIQRFALAVLYYATSGPTLWNEQSVGWLTSRPECEWGQSDLSCYDDGVVHWMGLWSGGLSGTLPKEIGLLTRLEWMNIHSNHFPGTIPTEVGLMTSLKHFDVRACNLGGTIPTESALLTKLTWLNIGVNELVGTIHSELGKLRALKWLNLPNNNLSGTIPTEIIVPNLQLLGAKVNYNLTGLLPTEVGSLTNLKYLYLSDTQVTGTVSPNLCDTFLDTEVDCFNIECDCCLGFNGSHLLPCPELIMTAEDAGPLQGLN